MPGGGVQVQAEVGVLPVPHLPAHLPHSHHVLDLLLDQARGRTCQVHILTQYREIKQQPTGKKA